MSLPLNMLSRLVITFLPRSKHLLISWLQSPSAVILEAQKIKSGTVSTVSPSISHEVMGPDASFCKMRWRGDKRNDVEGHWDIKYSNYHLKINYFHKLQCSDDQVTCNRFRQKQQHGNSLLKKHQIVLGVTWKIKSSEFWRPSFTNLFWIFTLIPRE